jgi:hypothetical protein
MFLDPDRLRRGKEGRDSLKKSFRSILAIIRAEKGLAQYGMKWNKYRTSQPFLSLCDLMFLDPNEL